MVMSQTSQTSQTSLTAETYFLSRRRRFDANFEWLRNSHPALAEKLKQHQLQNVPVFEENKLENLRAGGKQKFEKNDSENGEKSLTTMRHHLLTRPYSDPDSLFSLYFEKKVTYDQIGAQDLFYRFSDDMARYIQDIRADSGGPEGASHKREQAFRRVSPVVVQFGMGFGRHLRKIVQAFPGLRALFVWEPSLDVLWYAMLETDFVALSREMAKKKTKLVLYVEEKEFALKAMYHTIQQNYGLVFHSLSIGNYGGSIFHQRLIEKFEQYVGEAMPFGPGFWEDELIMFRNAWTNLCYGRSRGLNVNTIQTLRTPVFIVGSGPSLDRTLPYLKEQLAQSIVLSCGSALQILARHGVTPDFHVVIENGQENAWLEIKQSKTVDLSRVCLLAATTVQTSVCQAFEKVWLVSRETLTPHLFWRGSFLHAGQFAPDAGSAAVELAEKLGGTKLYLLGFDRGSKEEVFRSRHALPESDARFGKYEPTTTPRLRGALGGAVQDSQLLRFFRTCLVGQLANARALVYNASDGAEIEGAIPILPNLIPRTAHAGNSGDAAATQIERAERAEQGALKESELKRLTDELEAQSFLLDPELEKERLSQLIRRVRALFKWLRQHFKTSEALQPDALLELLAQSHSGKPVPRALLKMAAFNLVSMGLIRYGYQALWWQAVAEIGRKTPRRAQKREAVRTAFHRRFLDFIDFMEEITTLELSFLLEKDQTSSYWYDLVESQSAGGTSGGTPELTSDIHRS